MTTIDMHQDIRDAVTRLCTGFPGEYWRRLDEARAYPSEFVTALTEQGYLAALIPEEYGGNGLGLSAATAILEEIHRAGCNAAACHAQMYTMGTLLRHGSAEQKRRYLPGIAEGTLRLQAFGVTEPTSGTNTAALKTFARKEGDRYIVNGQKIWTSRAEYSDLMILLARTTPVAEVAKPTEGLSVFILDMRDAVKKGLRIAPIRTMMNHATCEVFFDDVEVPIANLVGEENRGWTYAKYLLAHERTNIADVNRAKRELERLKRIARAEGLWDDPRFRDQIALLEVDIVALEMLVLRVLSAERGGKQALDVAGLLKIRGSEIQQRYTELMMLACGPFGVPFIQEAMEAGWQGDHVGAAHCATATAGYLNYRKTTIYGGSNEVQRNIVAQTVLGS